LAKWRDDVLNMPSKTCPMCGMSLWLIAFGRDKTRKGGRAAYCRNCFRRYFRRWRARREMAAVEKLIFDPAGTGGRQPSRAAAHRESEGHPGRNAERN
jgi:hypothetical protein